MINDIERYEFWNSVNKKAEVEEVICVHCESGDTEKIDCNEPVSPDICYWLCNDCGEVTIIALS